MRWTVPDPPGTTRGAPRDYPFPNATCPITLGFMHIVVVMDPVSTVIVDEDTTFSLMLEAHQRGHRVDHCLLPDVELKEGRPVASVRRASLRRDPNRPVELGEPEHIDLAEVDAVLIRKDPPFDAPYLWLTLMLEQIQGDTLVVNNPAGIRAANEKIYACYFPELMPRTTVVRSKARIRSFLEELRADGASENGDAVIKPVDGHGGAGIFRISLTDGNFNAAVEAVTHQETRVAMVQQFVPEVTEGDKRILLLNGEPLGGILRVPQGGDHRSNIHVGGKVVAADLSPQDQHICNTIRAKLVGDRLYFVGIDVINGMLTEINVTSPTGIQQMSRLNGVNCEGKVIDWLESATAAAT